MVILNIRKFLLSLSIALFISTHSFAASLWNLSLDENNGLPKLTRGGGDVVTSSFLFFDKNYGWTNQESLFFKASVPNQYKLQSSNSSLGFTLNANVIKASSQKISWDFELDAKSGRKDVIGGGIVFRFNPEQFNQAGEPEILADNSGWRLGKGSKSVEMRFSPKPAAVFFEKNNKDELRVYFYSGSIPSGKKQVQAVLNLGGDIAITPTIQERFGVEDKSNWIPNIIDWKTSPIDLSILNASERPAGKRGFIKAKGEQLVFDDGTVARFWGTNISAYTIFGTPKDNVVQQAKRLSKLGVNLVRIHHFDSLWVSPNIFGDQSMTSTKKINQEAIDKIDWWIKCLKDEGIYVWLDLHVERHFKQDDKIEAFNEVARGKPDMDLKGFNYVNPSIQQAMRDFNTAYVTHLNPYTKTKYTDEPAIIAMLITNENDITNHFGNSLLPDKNVDYHSKRYMASAEDFAKKHGLSKDKTWRAWEHGPSKFFLNNLERQFNVEMIQHLRSLGVKVPIVTTSTWGNNPLSALPALTAGDMIDAHAYQPYGALESDPLFATNLTHWLSASQVVGMPTSVTEWNAEPFPLPDRHNLPLYVASRAGAQGWDAMMHYAYSQEPLQEPNQWQGRPSNWHAYNDPSMLATMPAAALMYRRGDVKEATSVYVLSPGDDLFNQQISPTNSAFIRTASELGKLQIAMPSIKQLPWLVKSNVASATVITDNPNQTLIKSSVEVTSDNKELMRNWEKGYATIDTTGTQAAMGWIGGQSITLANVVITSITPNAVIAVQSTDGNSISQSNHIFISLAARSVPKSADKLPFYSEPVIGQISIKAPKGLKLIKLGGDHQGKEVPVKYSNGQYTINLDKSIKTYWLALSK